MANTTGTAGTDDDHPNGLRKLRNESGAIIEHKLLISGTPHNNLAITNLCYLYADKAGELQIADGSYVQIGDFVMRVEVLKPDGLKKRAEEEKWLQKFEKTYEESKNTLILNGMHRDCLGLKQATDWMGKEMTFTPVEVLKKAAAASFQIEISQFPYKPTNPKKIFENQDLDKHLKAHFKEYVFRQGQRFFIECQPGNSHAGYLACEVKEVTLLSHLVSKDDTGEADKEGAPAEGESIAQLLPATNLYLCNGDGIAITGSMQAPKLLSPNFNYEELGIGGLHKEFMEIFRRAFATRLFPPAIIKNMGIKHVRGMLLYGPPGCGKTLVARQIGKMLNGQEPKVVNGPEILNKFVGQSEENIRNLFAEAEADLAQNGESADLHVIIFDEIDAICKQRTGSTQPGSHDTIVNQLLTKIDGVDAIDNILVIGMTNRKELLDDALLRPGRLEVHVEFSLPDKQGRLQIFAIHTAGMRENEYLAKDVDFDKIADRTKNYSGAEIEGVCKNAAAFALFDRNIDIDNPTMPKDLDKVSVQMSDFERAIDQIQPALGANTDELSRYIHGMIDYGPRYHNLLRVGQSFINQVEQNERTEILSVLLSGPAGSGKTALAAMLATGSNYPFIKLLSPQAFVGKHELEKCQKLAKAFEDAYKSPLSLVILDDIERLLEYVPIGPRFSNAVLQTLQVLVNKPPPSGHRLLVIGTSTNEEFLRDCDLFPCFNLHVEVPLLTKDEILKTLASYTLDTQKVFDDDSLAQLSNSIYLDIGIKQLLLITELAVTNSPGGMVNHETFVSAASDCGYHMA